MRTGNLAAVMRTIGHRDVKTAMHYQHPELEIVRAALDYRPSSSELAAYRKGLRHLLRHTKKPQSGQVIEHLASRRRRFLLAG